MSDNLEAQARELGWRPREEFKGDAAKWVDAETFVRRGEEVMPLLKAQNGKLRGEIDGLKGTVGQLQETIKANQEAMTELQKYHEEVAQRAYEKAKKDLRAERAQAIKDGDADRVTAIEEQLDELKPPPAPKKVETPAPVPAGMNPVLAQWEQDNAVWLAEPEKKAYAQAMANYLRATGSRLEGRAFLDELTKLVEKQFGGSSKRGEHVDGGGTPPPGGSRPRTFASLPAEAQAACDRAAGRLVGEGRAFKTLDDWRKQYVKDYQWE